MSQDTLSEVLRSVRLRGAVFYHVEGSESWVSESPAGTVIGDLVMSGIGHVMAYHVLTHGACWASLIGEPPVAMRAGDVVMFPRGDPHVLSSEPGMRGALDLRPYELPRPQQLPFLDSRQGEALDMAHLAPPVRHGATLVCGFFGCDAAPFNPLLASLPHLLHVSAVGTARDDRIAHFIRFALDESLSKRPGGEVLLEHLGEMMFVEVVRRYLASLPEDQQNWLTGLQDRYVGRALALLHERPGEPWTIERLAEGAGLSRSALHARFSRFTGYAPMHYLAKWRMQVAAALLCKSGAPIASIALEVGYESEAAFCRAFRRETCLPPATWRRQQHQLVASLNVAG